MVLIPFLESNNRGAWIALAAYGDETPDRCFLQSPWFINPIRRMLPIFLSEQEGKRGCCRRNVAGFPFQNILFMGERLLFLAIHLTFYTNFTRVETICSYIRI